MCGCPSKPDDNGAEEEGSIPLPNGQVGYGGGGRGVIPPLSPHTPRNMDSDASSAPPVITKKGEEINQKAKTGEGS